MTFFNDENSPFIRFVLKFSDVDEQKIPFALKHKLREFRRMKGLFLACVSLPLIYLRPWNIPLYIIGGIYSYRRWKKLMPELEIELTPYRNTSHRGRKNF